TKVAPGREQRHQVAVPTHSRHLDHLPVTQGLVQRMLWLERLTGEGPGVLVVICAPAGSGKTELLRSWVDAEGLADQVAWVTVERGEHEAQRFWLSVIDELAAAARRDGVVARGRRAAVCRRPARG